MDYSSIKHRADKRNLRYAYELESYYRTILIDNYAQRSGQLWKRDYRSIDAYKESIIPMRQAWHKLLNPASLISQGELEFEAIDVEFNCKAFWLRQPLGMLSAEGILSLPDHGEGPFPLVIAQHGLGSPPERIFGINDDGNIWHNAAKALLKAGFAVLAPMNLTTHQLRNRIQHMATLTGTTLTGLELSRMQRLLDAVLTWPQIDAERVGMWGLSLGGMATQFWVPLEPRIKVAISAAWFNHRPHKMAKPDPRYRCFLETLETHVFFNGWLDAFADEDLLSLVCPRPMLIQSGKADAIAWWPQIVECFHRLHHHYKELGVSDRAALDMHDGVHEVRIESGVDWLTKWLA